MVPGCSGAHLGLTRNAIAIAALLYVLATGHAHHAIVDDAPVSFGVEWK
jgi:hypothetical protein